VCTYADWGSDRESKIQEMVSQDIFSAIWLKFQPDTNIHFEPSIQEALDTARKQVDGKSGMQALVTGSLHLVGGALSLLKPGMPT
jgi:folylpolyglutamate synthase